jgi:toxin ParE1/3/4
VKVRYRPRAEADLEGIAVYTRQEWGHAQAVLYVTQLRETCERVLPEHYRLARPLLERPDVLRWRCERHVIYFMRDAEGLDVVRILHERMLPGLHL